MSHVPSWMCRTAAAAGKADALETSDKGDTVSAAVEWVIGKGTAP